MLSYSKPIVAFSIKLINASMTLLSIKLYKIYLVDFLFKFTLSTIILIYWRLCPDYGVEHLAHTHKDNVYGMVTHFKNKCGIPFKSVFTEPWLKLFIRDLGIDLFIIRFLLRYTEHFLYVFLPFPCIYPFLYSVHVSFIQCNNNN